MNVALRCHACGTEFEPACERFRCDCGGLLDLAPFPVRWAPDPAERSLFRYAAALPCDEACWRPLSLGEGLTPMVPFDPADPSVLLKLDYAMPTLSFKDRGAVLVVAQARALGARRLVQDSSGNAGAAVAAYAARAGLPCDIFVPAATSARKTAQIAAYGARVVAVPGSREDTARAALEAACRPGSRYASHVYDPMFFQGTKTYVYEIFEALDGRLPEQLYLPLGNGTLVLGVYLGLLDLRAQGHLRAFPKVVAVQAEGCAPILRAHAGGAARVAPVENRGTDAEGIAIAAPLRGTQILAALRELGAEVVVAPEAGLAAARAELAGRGFHVETTSAAAWAAFRARPRRPGQTVILPLCGAGLKGC